MATRTRTHEGAVAPAAEAETQPQEKKKRLHMPSMLRAMRHRNYRLYFSGQLVSLVGTWMQNVAQGWLILQMTNSPLLLGMVSAAASLPVIALSLMGGSIADRVPKRTLLVCTQSGAMLLALILAILTLTNTVQVWHVLLLATLLGVVNAFDGPARQAFTVEIVGRDDLLNAIALNSSIFNSARIIGPAIAGMVVALIGEGPAFLVNGISFIAVIAGLLAMRLPHFVPAVKKKTGNSGHLREGLSYIWRERTVLRLLFAAGSLSLFGFIYVPLLPVFAQDVLHVGASGFGLLSTAGGIGALTAALSLAQFSDKIPRGKVMTVSMLLFPLFVIGFTLMPTISGEMFFLALVGLASVTTNSLVNTLIQIIVPDELRGRVMSVFMFLMRGLSPLGGLAAGGLAQLTGNAPVVVAISASIAWICAIAITITSPQLRRL